MVLFQSDIVEYSDLVNSCDYFYVEIEIRDLALVLNIENMCSDHHAHTYCGHYAHLVDKMRRRMGSSLHWLNLLGWLGYNYVGGDDNV